MKYIFAVILLLLLVACVEQGPTGEVVSEAPLDASDEAKVLQDITPHYSETTDFGEAPATDVAIPEEDAGLPRKIVQEGELVSFPNLRANDPDGDPIEYTFSAPLDEFGMWQTEKGDAGAYRITITASDGKSQVKQEVIVVVEGTNQPPVFEEMDVIQVTEGEEVVLSPKVSDPDGDELILTYDGWLKTNRYQTTPDDAGIHIVTVTASDGIHKVTYDMKVQVSNKNRAPVLQPLSPVTINEGDTLLFEPTVSDPDGDDVKVTCSLPLTPACSWKTGRGDAGTYTVVMTANDGSSSVSEEVKVTVYSTNQPPIISGPDEIIVIEGETVSLENLVISDPDGDEVLVSYEGWMSGVSRETSYQDAGTHKVFVHASDGQDTVTHEIEVRVRDRNRPPTFNPESFN